MRGRAGRQSTAIDMLFDFIHDQGRKLLQPCAHGLASLAIKPTSITVAGFLVCVFAAGMAWMGWYWQAGLLFAVGSLFDALDGSVARMNGTVSQFGAALDSTLDRVAEAVLFIALLSGSAAKAYPGLVYVASFAMVGSLMVSYVRARAEGLGIPCEVGFFTRMERLIVIIVGLLFADIVGGFMLLLACALVAFGAWITVLQRLLTVLKSDI